MCTIQINRYIIIIFSIIGKFYVHQEKKCLKKINDSVFNLFSKRKPLFRFYYIVLPKISVNKYEI